MEQTLVFPMFPSTPPRGPVWMSVNLLDGDEAPQASGRREPAGGYKRLGVHNYRSRRDRFAPPTVPRLVRYRSVEHVHRTGGLTSPARQSQFSLSPCERAGVRAARL